VGLYLIAAALFGLTVWQGIYWVLLNLYLLRLGYGPEFIGLVNAVGLLTCAVISLPAGALGGRWGTRRVMVAGLSLAAVGHALLPLAGRIPPVHQAGWLLASYCLGWLGMSAYLVNANPFLAGATSAEERAYAFAVRMAIMPLAGFVGSAVGGQLPGASAKVLRVAMDSPAAYGWPLLIAALLLIPAVMALLATRGGSSALSTRQTEPEAGPAPYRLIALMALVILLQLASEGTARTFSNVYLNTALQVPTAQIGWLSAAGQLLSVPAALATPPLMARWGKGRTYALASLGVALCLLPVALIPHWAAAGLGFMGMVALAAIARPASMVYHQEIVTPGWRAAMSGSTTMASALSWAAMAFGGGYLITALGYRRLFLTGAGITTAGVLLFWATFGVPRGETRHG
jgi:MFS family permease